ncbi:hypothetical protein ACR9E3_02210 [Actinomycetospora sp. C-140]
MAATTASFDRFGVSYLTGNSRAPGAITAVVQCFSGDGEVAQLQFFPRGVPVTLPGGLGSSGNVVLYFGIDDLPGVLDVLRRTPVATVALDPDEGHGALYGATEQAGDGAERG